MLLLRAFLKLGSVLGTALRDSTDRIMENRFSQHITIPCYETDAAQLLKPASFMDFAQEAANRHAELLGFGYDDLSRTRTLWVLSRMHVKFLRHPRWREETVLHTWHKGPSMMFHLRDFLMTASDGQPLVTATTSWLVINVDTRRIVRELSFSGEDSICRDNAIETPCGKVQMPGDAGQEIVGTHVVSYSDVDLNGHANNAMYIVWAMDAADYEVTSARPLKELKINFNHETRPGESILISRARADVEDGIRYSVEGKSGDRQAFCAELLF